MSAWIYNTINYKTKLKKTAFISHTKPPFSFWQTVIGQWLYALSNRYQCLLIRHCLVMSRTFGPDVVQLCICTKNIVAQLPFLGTARKSIYFITRNNFSYRQLQNILTFRAVKIDRETLVHWTPFLLNYENKKNCSINMTAKINVLIFVS